ncbi:acyl-CoA thioesterase [Phreatobacter stygius]|uniref:acyl-CoA thioesterase n=1 Tax=Phreatobacter stygius TaxID=1940610 RepID=UPI00269290DD
MPSDLTTLHPFDQATGIRAEGDHLTGATSDLYWAFVGPFGGATAATMLRAVLDHGERRGEPLALTVNYCAPIQRGGFAVDVRLVRANRSSQHWAIELTQAGEGVVATATAVFAERRPSWSHQAAAMPQVRPAAEVPALPNDKSSSWLRQYEFRFASGDPRFGATLNEQPASARSEVWLSDSPPRPVDALSLAAMADAFFGRIFHVRGGLVPFGTVSMTTYFHVDAADLAAEAITGLLGVADAHVFHKSYADQTAELWSPSGRLLATSQQIAYFKA